jgi:DNA-binding MarR family transcriptional regulator
MGSDVVVESLGSIVFGGVAMTAAALEQATGGQEISFTQWRAIVFIGESVDGSRVTDIAQRLMAGLPGTSRLLRRLELRGLITLQRDQRDRRVTRAQLTEDGRRVREAVLAWRHQRIAALTRDVEITPEVELTLQELAARFEADGRRPAGRGRITAEPAFDS